jgi:PIN domain nuclease of toxin-antitoxin system
MNVLLDTHAFLWFIGGDSRISQLGRDVIENPQNNVHLSLVSVWEMALKVVVRKLEFDQPLQELVEAHSTRNQIKLLAISMDHIQRTTELPLHHRDPFDRLLVAQCLVEKVCLVSIDAALDPYGIDRIW